MRFIPPLKKDVTVLQVIFLSVTLILCLAMIFGFSSQEGVESGELSKKIAEGLIRLFRPDYDSLPRQERNRLLNTVHLYVRKAAHFSEFALLALLLRQLLNLFKDGWPLSAATLVFCVAAAAADEYHQSYVPGRSSQWTDVMIDSAGAVAGLLLSLLILRYLRKRKQKKVVNVHGNTTAEG